MSKIASIETIKQVRAHPNADRLDLVKVLGYQCVTQKGLYKEGDIVIYIQPDSILPEEPWAEEYRKYSPKRIKAVKLRFEWSEGCLLPIETFLDIINKNCVVKRLTNIEKKLTNKYTIDDFINQIGLDVSEMLNIKHYEPPMPQDFSAKGLLPFGIPKTDEERWENLVSVLPIGEAVDVTLKIDGQSWSAYYKLDQDAFGVLGRTMEYKLECGNRYTAQIARYDIENKLRAFCQKHNVSLCIRGESYGEGLQNFSHNPHSKEKAGLALFSVYLIDERRYARKGDPFYFDLVAAEMGLPTVEFVERDVLLTPELIQKYSADLNNIGNQPFEGVVINHSTYTREVEIENDGFKGIAKYNEPAGSFKIINKNYDARK